ncbi:MAG: hypothetical protein JWN14_1684, partial [Chthonomonadales bacterium]|nr:hypothetical protein [Chthonomonadales bacterium]
SPTSSGWRDLASVAVAYGLTKGGWNANQIMLGPLGRRATESGDQADKLQAHVEAILRPKVFHGFFNKYNKNKFPADNIARNVLRQEFNVPAEKVNVALSMIKDNGQFVGFIRETKTGPFVVLDNPQPMPVRMSPEPEERDLSAEGSADNESETPHDQSTNKPPETNHDTPPIKPNHRELQVFITHGKNLGIVEQVKDILSLYDIEFEVAVEEETAAIPVPEKVMAAMRRCSAGVMVVTADEQERTEAGFHINTNVLIEIGAAFVLYDQAVILLWDKRLKVPSNLQGLYRIEFESSELSFATGTRLAKAVKSLLKAPKP